MPISSGAGGRTTRLHLPGGSSKRTYWPNNVNPVSGKSLAPASSVSLINEEPLEQSGNSAPARVHSAGSLTFLQAAGSGDQKGRPKTKSSKASGVASQKQAPSEKYRRIRNISRPNSLSTTSTSSLKYLADPQADDEAGGAGAGHEQAQPESGVNLSSGRDATSDKAEGSSLGSASNLTPNSADQHSGNSPANKPWGLLSSLITLGASNQKAGHNQDAQPSTTMKRPANLNLATAHYQPAAAINQHNSQTSLNPSLQSSAFGIKKTGVGSQPAVSTNSSTANLHSLSSLHQRPTTTINKRFNLKYVKTLIVVLMSLDLLVTIFVHHFASNDEFSLVFTSSKLRFSLVNLVLSAIWFIVLTGAILFDVYLILLVGCIVDIASFILLLACSTIHFTQRIDYNTVSLASLLMLLFSIIVLHVYLLVIAALTIYLMIAVKRRRKH